MSDSGAYDDVYFDDGTKRGTIRNPELHNQPLDFSGCRVGKCTPSDIDGIMDFQGKLFIVLEVKYGNSEMHTGQRLLMENLARNSKAPMYILQIRHFEDAPQVVDVGDCQVTRYFYKNEWRIPEAPITVGNAIQALCKIHNIKIHHA